MDQYHRSKVLQELKEVLRRTRRAESEAFQTVGQEALSLDGQSIGPQTPSTPPGDIAVVDTVPAVLTPKAPSQVGGIQW